MKKSILLTLFLSIGIAHAQRFSTRWSDWFSYNHILAICEDGKRLVAATESGIFYYTFESGEIAKLSKASGLHNVNISAFDYNSDTQTALIGYTDGSMDVVTPEGITYVVDIPISQNVTGNRKINHISITGDQAVISAEYGISVFNLKRKEFGESVLLSGVRESVLRDNTVYAATSSGIKKHVVDNAFPIPHSWQTIVSGNFTNIDIDKHLMAYTSQKGVWYSTGESFKTLGKVFSDIKDITINGEYIVVTESNSVSVFNDTSPVQEYNSEKPLNTAWFNNGIFAGTTLSGIITDQNLTIKPDGPFANKSYKLYLSDGKIWVSTGGQKNRYNEADPDKRNLGFYFYNGSEWIYPSYFLSNNQYLFNILDVVANPTDDKEVFFANYNQQPKGKGHGFFRMIYQPESKDFVFGKYYAPPVDYPHFNRMVGLAFSDKNDLYGSISVLSLDGKAYSAGYSVYDRTSDLFIYNKLPFQYTQKPLFYENFLWIGDPRTSVLGMVDLHNTPLNINDDTVRLVNNNFPGTSQGVISLAFDQSGEAWIGTDKGLRILTNPLEINSNPQVHSVIINQNGIGEELFRDSEILQIEVDGGNQKWVSVNGGGVYYLSADGQRTIHHFTKENSPLPNNSVTDIKVDRKTGKVYFATNDGIMVYHGDITHVDHSFHDVTVYPNPVVYKQFKGNITIKGLTERTNIRITDTAGNLVHQGISHGGTYEWNLMSKGKRISSGIYFVLMTNEDGTDKATAKIAVIN